MIQAGARWAAVAEVTQGANLREDASPSRCDTEVTGMTSGGATMVSPK